MARYVIHVGPHKTGTKYLQGCFAKMRSVLEPRGIIYPDRRLGDVGHSALVKRLSELDPLLLSEFAALRESCATVLISAEDLIDLSAEAVNLLKECVDGSSVTLVYYCRRWTELLSSGWQEMVKHGATQALPEFVAAHMMDPCSSNIINCGRILRKYGEAFGTHSLRLVSYDEIVDSGLDLLTHFTGNFLNFVDPHMMPARVNKSMDLLDTEVVRALNTVGCARGCKPDGRICERYLQARQGLRVDPLFDAMGRFARYLRSDETAEWALSLHRKLIGEFGAQVVPPRPDNFLFRPRISQIPYVGSEYLMNDGIMDLLTHLYDQLNLASAELME